MKHKATCHFLSYQRGLYTSALHCHSKKHWLIKHWKSKKLHTRRTASRLVSLNSQLRTTPSTVLPISSPVRGLAVLIRNQSLPSNICITHSWIVEKDYRPATWHSINTHKIYAFPSLQWLPTVTLETANSPRYPVPSWYCSESFSARKKIKNKNWELICCRAHHGTSRKDSEVDPYFSASFHRRSIPSMCAIPTTPTTVPSHSRRCFTMSSSLSCTITLTCKPDQH